MNDQTTRSSLIAPLHFITMEGHCVPHVQQVLLACQAGVKWIQLRIKQGSKDEMRCMAKEARRICSQHRARLIINDHLDIALECGADGLHLGQQDMPLAEARKRGSHLIIGGTANTPEQALDMAGQGADYIGAGPFRFTATKKNLSPILGFSGMEAILERLDRERVPQPVVAVGGIRLEDLEKLLALPLHGIAISGAIARAAAPGEVVEKIAKHFNNRKDHVSTR